MFTPSEIMPVALVDLAAKIERQFRQMENTLDIMKGVAVQLEAFGASGIKKLMIDATKDINITNIICKNSYFHENGFCKITLLSHPFFTMRLHIWLPNFTIKETLHDHRWYFASHIISGSLTSEIWQDSISPRAKRYVEYMYTDKNTEPKLTGTASVECIKKTTRQAGESYIFMPEQLHRIISSGEDMTATLICRSTPVKSFSRNIITNGLIPDVTPSFLTQHELHDVFTQFLKTTTQ